jgi:ComF family protein
VVEHGTPALERCLAAVDYAFPWDGLISRFKFRGEPGLAQPLAALLLKHPGVESLLRTSDRIVPVPVTPSRLAERGYNQAWELSKALLQQAQHHRAQGLQEGLIRQGESPDQHQLNAEQRAQNLKNAFTANPKFGQQLRGARVLLVDDVSTTGATLRAAAHALRLAGVRRISAVVLARTPVD